MRGRDAGTRIAGAFVALALVSGAAGCIRRAVETPVVSPPPVVAPAPPAPSAGERYLASAREALGRGADGEARERLEFILALEADTPERPEALFLLGLLLADPDSPDGDPARAAGLLEQAASSLSPPERRAEARLVLELVRENARQSNEIAQLRAWLQEMESDSVQLRAALDQREQELQKLKKIKEILLGKASEP